MDEIEQFSALRPADVTFSEAERSAIHQDVFGAHDAAVERGEGVGEILLDGGGANGRRGVSGTRASAMAAGALAGIGLAALGIWSAVRVAGDDDNLEINVAASEQTTISVTQSGSTPPNADEAGGAAGMGLSLGPTARPLVLVDLPDWELSYASDSSAAIGLVLATDGGLNGPIATAELADPGVGISLGDDREVEIGQSAGQMSGRGDVLFLSWTDQAGNDIWLNGWKVDEEELVDMAEVIQVNSGGQLGFSGEVPGYVVVDTESAEAMGGYVEYQFEGPDGIGAQVSFYPGGPFVQGLRASPTEQESVSFGDETGSIKDYGDGRYRLGVVRGFWYWEIDASSFDSRATFLDFVAKMRVVDESEWSQALPGNVVGTSDRQAAIGEMLGDVPHPTDLDVEALAEQDKTLDRYQLGAEVTGAVACAWLDIWIDATQNGDAGAAEVAADALASSRTWPILIEMNQSGGWSEVLWEFADRVNSADGQFDEDIAAQAASSLGCGR